MHACIRDTQLFLDFDGAAFLPDGDTLVQRPVVLLHPGGPGGDHSHFKPSYNPLREVAQLVYLDPRGCGRSTPGDPAAITLDNHIDDVDAVRAYLGLPRITLLGSSYGGMVALGYATRYPERL